MNHSFPVALAAALLAVASAGADYPLPPDGPAFDVTRPPFGARGDGRSDDTEAQQRAITAEAKGKRLVYLPDGVYLVSRPLVTAKKRTILHGQSREKSIIKLKDDCPGFGDPENPQIVLQAGHAGSNDFFNSVHNLTVDVGRGNPGAVAMRYHTSNQGAVTNVLLRSSPTEKMSGRISSTVRRPSIHPCSAAISLACRASRTLGSAAALPAVGFAVLPIHVTRINSKRIPPKQRSAFDAARFMTRSFLPRAIVVAAS